MFKAAKQQNLKGTALPLLLLLIPIISSYYLRSVIKEGKPLKVLIVQPNVDPYADKFNVGYEKQLDEFIALAKTKLTEEIQLLVGPETALLEEIWENKFEKIF